MCVCVFVCVCCMSMHVWLGVATLEARVGVCVATRVCI